MQKSSGSKHEEKAVEAEVVKQGDGEETRPERLIDSIFDKKGA